MYVFSSLKKQSKDIEINLITYVNPDVFVPFPTET